MIGLNLNILGLRLEIELGFSITHPRFDLRVGNYVAHYGCLGFIYEKAN